MAKLAPLGPFRALGGNATPLSGGLLYTYEAGTTTPKDTYTDSAGMTANSNPVVLDSQGFADVWLGGGAYKFVLKYADGSHFWDEDNITGDSLNTFGASVVILTTTTAITTVYNNSFLVCTDTLTLPLLPLAEAGEGFVISVRNQGTGVVTIEPDAAEEINGQASLLIGPGQSCIIIAEPTGWFTIGGGIITQTQVKTANYSPVFADRVRPILCNATGGAFTISPLSAATAGNGFELIIKKTDASANAVTIDFAGTETGDGATTIILRAQNDYIRLVSDGVNWFSIGRKIATDQPGQVTLASAATVSLASAASPNSLITGVVTITSLGTSGPITGALYHARFTDILTLTHNAVSLIIPGGANILTAAGDSAIIEDLGGNNWRVRHYQRADGTAISNVFPSTAGALNTTMLAFYGSAATFGSTVAGSGLKPCSAANTDQGAVQAGTWRCMGACNGVSNNSAGVTLWQRIS